MENLGECTAIFHELPIKIPAGKTGARPRATNSCQRSYNRVTSAFAASKSAISPWASRELVAWNSGAFKVVSNSWSRVSPCLGRLRLPTSQIRCKLR